LSFALSHLAKSTVEDGHHDRSTGRTILQVQSRATGEVIEQIPSEALLQLYAAMRETLVDERA
jgi:uncharacterized FlaG/YvyC family protein